MSAPHRAAQILATYKTLFLNEKIRQIQYTKHVTFRPPQRTFKMQIPEALFLSNTPE